MLSARRKSDGQAVTAYLSSKSHAPFVCIVCNDPVVLKIGRGHISHFAHANPLACRYAENESEAHKRCKMEIYIALSRQPGVRNVTLECPLENVRPDVSAEINGVPVAIEVQISSLSPETIQRRTIEYARDGIYVLWLLQWTPKLDARRYTPRLWEKWIHAAYFGRVYYWTHGLNVVSYHFDPIHRTIPKKTWYSESGKKMTAGGYSQRSKRYRTPVRGRTFNLATDFGPRNRDWWEGNGIVVPAAKLYIDRHRLSVPAEFYEA